MGGDATLGVSTMPRGTTTTRGSVAAGGGGIGAAATGEYYRATRADMHALFAKTGAHGNQHAGQMHAAYDASLRIVDVWKAPPVPVVCVMGAGERTQVGYLYREPWPKNMDEEPCPVTAARRTRTPAPLQPL